MLCDTWMIAMLIVVAPFSLSGRRTDPLRTDLGPGDRSSGPSGGCKSELTSDPACTRSHVSTNARIHPAARPGNYRLEVDQADSHRQAGRCRRQDYETAVVDVALKWPAPRPQFGPGESPLVQTESSRSGKRYPRATNNATCPCRRIISSSC